MAFVVGDRILVMSEDDPALWHERLIIGVVHDALVFVATPDNELVLQDLAGNARGIRRGGESEIAAGTFASRLLLGVFSWQA